MVAAPRSCPWTSAGLTAKPTSPTVASFSMRTTPVSRSMVSVTPLQPISQNGGMSAKPSALRTAPCPSTSPPAPNHASITSPYERALPELGRSGEERHRVVGVDADRRGGRRVRARVRCRDAEADRRRARAGPAERGREAAQVLFEVRVERPAAWDEDLARPDEIAQ